MFRFLEEYAKHSALNFGQVLQGIRYVYSHPTADAAAPRGSMRHLVRSMGIRSKRIVNDLFFAVLPPHWHHTSRELASMTRIPISQWFQFGYAPWRFDESGQLRKDLPADVDKRWDPRCDD